MFKVLFHRVDGLTIVTPWPSLSIVFIGFTVRRKVRTNLFSFFESRCDTVSHPTGLGVLAREGEVTVEDLNLLKRG